MKDTDLPEEWTAHYGAFIAFGDTAVMGTCRECFSVVVSDYFADHTGWHLEQV